MHPQRDPSTAPAAARRQCIGCQCNLAPLLPADVVQCSLCRTAVCTTCGDQVMERDLQRTSAGNECGRCRSDTLKAAFDRHPPGGPPTAAAGQPTTATLPAAATAATRCSRQPSTATPSGPPAAAASQPTTATLPAAAAAATRCSRQPSTATPSGPPVPTMAVVGGAAIAAAPGWQHASTPTHPQHRVLDLSIDDWSTARCRFQFTAAPCTSTRMR